MRDVRVYEKDTKVIYTSSLHTGHGEPEKVSGTVIAMFQNNGLPTHRVRLDKVWPEDAGPLAGRPMVVGNVHAISLALKRDS